MVSIITEVDSRIYPLEYVEGSVRRAAYLWRKEGGRKEGNPLGSRSVSGSPIVRGPAEL